MRRVIVTGGPGAGKTTLLREFASRGYVTVDESARAIIAERLAAGRSPRPPSVEFAKEILRRDIEKYNQVAGRADWVLFDRGVIEALCMVHDVAPLPQPDLASLLATYPFHRTVLVLPPWQEIYRTDAQRDQTFEDAVSVHQNIVRWYERCGYRLHEVPCISVEDRADHVIRVLREAPIGSG